mgnify:CR=1 FL=1
MWDPASHRPISKRVSVVETDHALPLTEQNLRCVQTGGRGGGLLPDLLQATRLGEIDAESIPSALIPAGHFGRGMAELPLHIALFDLG